MMSKIKIGPPTASSTYHPGTLNPNTNAGRPRKEINRYIIANHLYLAVVFPKIFARRTGIFLMNGTGYQIKMPDMLKNKWHSETCNDLRTDWRSSDAIAARIAVHVVPIFEPRVSGYILSSVITPTPTRGVSAEVKMLDDCTSIVMRAPIRIAR